MVTVEIKFATGIIFVYGSQYEVWIDRTFDSWRSLAVDGVHQPLNITPPTAPSSGSSITSDLNADVERLWEEHTSLKNAFTTLDSTVNNLSTEIHGLVKAINDIKSSQEEISRANLSKNDEKIQVFLTTASDECVGNISKCKVEMKAEIEKFRTLSLKQEARFQSITDLLKNEMQNSKSSDNTSLKWTHLENVRKSCSNLHDNMDNQFQSMKEKMDAVSDQVDSLATAPTRSDELIARIDNDIQHLQKRLDVLIKPMNVTTPATTTANPSVRTPSIYNTPDVGNSNEARFQDNPHGRIPPEATSRNNNTSWQENGGRQVKLFVWTDSNGKHLKPEKFWQREGTKFERTYLLQDVKRCLDINRDTNIGCILISCGANDIEEKTGHEVAQDIIGTVNRIKQEHPSTKIVISEVTPFFARDQEVRTCNEELHKQLTAENIHVAKLDNLRDETWSKFRDDRKHIKQNCVPLFAGILIAALRRAHNMAPRNQRSQTRRDDVGNQRRHPNEARFQNNHHDRPPYPSHPPQPPQPPHPPRPLMSNFIQNEPYMTNTTNHSIPIGHRLQSIAVGKPIDPKQNLISKLTEVLKHLQVW